MADHPHPQARNKPTHAHHWNQGKYEANLIAGTQMLEQGHVGFGSSVRKGKFDFDFWVVVGYINLPESEQDPRLRLIHGKKPADAIDAMFQHPERWSFDCAEFVQAVELFAIRNAVGPDVFNANQENMFFRQHRSTGLAIKQSWERDKGGTLRRYPEGSIESKTFDRIFKEVKVGSEVTLKNTDPIAIGKVWESENTIKIGPDLFIAHGVRDGIVNRN